jgi:hypothetical protein
MNIVKRDNYLNRSVRYESDDVRHLILRYWHYQMAAYCIKNNIEIGFSGDEALIVISNCPTTKSYIDHINKIHNGKCSHAILIK